MSLRHHMSSTPVQYHETLSPTWGGTYLSWLPQDVLEKIDDALEDWKNETTALTHKLFLMQMECKKVKQADIPSVPLTKAEYILSSPFQTVTVSIYLRPQHNNRALFRTDIVRWAKNEGLKCEYNAGFTQVDLDCNRIGHSILVVFPPESVTPLSDKRGAKIEEDNEMWGIQ